MQYSTSVLHSTSTTALLDKGQQVCRQPCSITAHAAQVTNSAVQHAKHACSTHASVLQYSTSVLHSTSTTALLDKGQQVCRQPCSITAHAAQVTNSAVQHASKHNMQVSCNTAQVCCTALAPLLCLTRASRFAGSHVALPLMLLKSPTCFAVKACMQAAHASVLQYSTSVLHSTSTTALLDKGQQVCRQPCSITAHAAQVTNLLCLLSKHACKQHMQVSCSTAQVCCTALAPLLCLTRASRFAGSHVALPLMLLKSPTLLSAAKACMQAAHASVLQYSTSVLHSTSTTALLDKGQQVCRQPCSITAHAAQVTNSAVQLQASCQSMHASSTCKCLAVQHKCVAQH